MNRRWLLFAALLALSCSGLAQVAISPRAGLIHHIEGEVLINGEEVEPDPHQFVHLPEGQALRTQEGRAEIVLGPGNLLRTSRSSLIRLVSDDLTDVRVKILDGAVVLDCRRIDKNTRITLVHRGAEVRIKKPGLYRLDSASGDTPVLKVYRGSAIVIQPEGRNKLKKNRAIELTEGKTKPYRFDPSETDALDEWREERNEVVAELNQITPYSNSQLLDGLSSLTRNSSPGGRRPAHHGRTYPSSSRRK